MSVRKNCREGEKGINKNHNSEQHGTVEWWKKAVFYQIYPRSFQDSNNDGIGDLPGIISRLDYLNDGTPASLGVDAIWLSPFFTGPEHDFGYDIADYCSVDPRFGTIADFDCLIVEAHRRNIKVILDLVVNHTSHLHPWFQESRSSRSNPRRDWYIWRDGKGKNRKPPNNWRNNFFGSAWTFDEKSGQYYLHSFLKEQPDLNWRNPKVRKAVEEIMCFWLEHGADGFRLDVPHIYCKDQYFRDNPPFFRREKIKTGPRLLDRLFMSNVMKLLSLPELQVRKYNQHQPETHEVLRMLRTVLDHYPGTTSVGEIIADDPALIASYYGENNDELHMNFYFELLHCRWKAGAFRRSINRWEKVLPRGAWPAYALSNHDVVRAASRYGGGLKGKKRARLLAMLLLTLRGTPFLYYGEEVAMQEVKLPKGKIKDPIGQWWYPLNRGRDGCRTPMQWNGEANAGFSPAEPWLPVGPDFSLLNVAEQDKDPRSHLNFIKRLLQMRKSFPALQTGDYESLDFGSSENVFSFRRQAGEEKLLICLNFSSCRQEIQLLQRNNQYRLLLSTGLNGRPEGSSFQPFLFPHEGIIIEEHPGV
ncbi:MAG: alpha-amylase family glycosyl hydrolase [Bacillota bacterium]|nr:alpha-amylase family glycosyl hydrolase [Bacillota bacterium]